MLAKIISYIPAIIGMLFLGWFVFLNNPSSKRNKTFFIFNISICTWLLCLLIADLTQNNTVALWAFRLALFFGTLVFLAFLYFSITFPTNSNVSRKWIYLASVPLIGAAFLSLTPASVTSVEITEYGVQPKDIGIIYTISDVLSILYIVVGVVIILLKYNQSSLVQRQQTRIFVGGLSIAVSVNIITGFVLTQLNIQSSATFLGGFSLLIFSCFIAYAIMKHKLFDLRLVVARAIAYGLLITTLSAIYAVVVFGVANELLGSDSVFAQQVVPIIAAIVLVFTAPFFKRLFDRITNRFFYQDAYDPQALMDELNGVLIGNIELSILLRHASEVIQRHIKIEFCAVAVHESQDSPLRIVGTKDMHLNTSSSAFLRKEMSMLKAKTIITDDLDSHHAKLKKILRDGNVAIAIKLRPGSSESGDLAYMLLGPKRSGNMYGKGDLKVIDIVADSMVIAIQNALRFEEIQGFAATLQEKVEEATAKLKRTNAKLKELDETKDEFISMASHQLRTPLTSVKGYLSMVLEGDTGKVDPKQKKLLNQAYISSQRMVYLIADLLNVSRLKTGKFVIVAAPTNLADVVEGEISQLTETAKSKKIALKYKKPKGFPLLNLDETKIRQVIMNFADNAIYYTPSGGEVKIEVSEDRGNVYVMVKDNGLGIPKEEQKQLFGKFFRASNAKRVRPDGTGLGLFMAKKVVAAQGGNIIFESTEGKGSTFGFSFSKSKLRVD